MPFSTWQEQLRRGGLDLAILLTVSTGPRYGLAIIQHLEAFTDLVITEGTIYPILGRLTREGLLASEWVEGDAPHARKYYRLTRLGVTRLGEMQAQWQVFTGKIGRLIAAAERGGTMVLSEAGEARVRGYLFVLQRSLKLGLPRTVAGDATREIESHLRERIAAVSAADERVALEQILAELGPPLRVAQAYSAEHLLDEAVVTGRLIPMARALLHLAVTTVLGFLTALGLVAGYLIGATFLVLGILKPIFPDNVGFWVVNGERSLPTSLGIKLAPAVAPAGGNWVILIGLVFGVGFLVLTHLGARRFLAWWLARRSTGFAAAGGS